MINDRSKISTCYNINNGNSNNNNNDNTKNDNNNNKLAMTGPLAGGS